MKSQSGNLKGANYNKRCRIDRKFMKSQEKVKRIPSYLGNQEFSSSRDKDKKMFKNQKEKLKQNADIFNDSIKVKLTLPQQGEDKSTNTVKTPHSKTRAALTIIKIQLKEMNKISIRTNKSNKYQINQFSMFHTK